MNCQRDEYKYKERSINVVRVKDDGKSIFCKRCRKFKPVKGSVWDFVYSGFLCDSCYKKLLNLFNKENK